jgi:hypothetical protein
MTAPVHAPPVIHVLAERLRAGVVDCAEALKGIGDNDPITVENVLGNCFNDDDRETLLEWIRGFMKRKHESYVAARRRAGAPADGTGLYATRDPVSRDVAVALGFTSNPFEPQHGTIVWWLCKLAGWQDGQP